MRATFVAWLFLGTTIFAIAQDQVVLDKGKQLRELLRTVAKYPPEVRQAIPVVAQYPKLPGELLDAIGDKKQSAIDEALAKYPKDVQAAGKKLATSPEALEVMMSQRAITEMVGKAYAEMGPEKLKALADELRRDDAKTQDSITAWAKRLKGNRAALHQLLDATHTYVEGGKDVEGFQDFGLGCAVTDRQQAVVYALPAAPLTTFVLVNADLYTDLADEMIEQWLRTNSQDDFDLVMGSWWNLVRQYAMPTILEPEKRSDRLKAIATLAERVGEKYPKERPPFEERVKFVKENLADFPDLKPHLLAMPKEMTPPKEGEVIKKPEVAVKPPPPPPTPPAKTTEAAKSSGSETTTPPKANTSGSTTTTTAKKLPPPPQDVSTAAPTAEQQTRLAANNQNFYWYQYNNVTPGYVPYNYYGYANPYFGAYNTGRDGWPNRPIHGNGGMNRPIGGGGRRR